METAENNQNQTGNTTPAAGSGDTATSSGDKKILMAVLAYLSILIIIPFLMAREDAFVKHHLKQGLVLFALWIIVWVADQMIWSLYAVFGLLQFGIFVLAIIGIVNAIQGNMKEVPLVGQFGKSFNI